MSSRQGSRRRPGLKASGFIFTDHMRELCRDITLRMPQLAHVDADRIAFSFAQARKAVMHGMQASLTPLRFEGGSLIGEHEGRRVTVQRVFNNAGAEMLYILTFYLPRFMNLGFREKLVTIFHELWHVSPDFDGDLRRHPGRCYAHTRSEAEYDARMWGLAQQWLSLGPPDSLYEFLLLDFNALRSRHGQVFGTRIARPQLIPCPS